MTDSQKPHNNMPITEDGNHKDRYNRYFPWLLLLEAVIFLYLAHIMFLVLPFKRCLRLMAPPKKPENKSHQHLLVHIRRAIRRANKLALWSNKCLVMTATARWMLSRRKIPSTMFFGVKPGSNPPGNLAAHAWIISQNVQIVKKNGEYVVMHSM